MARKRRRSKKNIVKVDFTGVEAGGRVPEGDYIVKVKEVTVEESQSGNPYLKWVLEVADGRHSGKKLYHNTSLQPQALFNLRATLEALGMEVPQRALNLDLDTLIGLSCAVSVETENYQGRDRARVVEVFHVEDLIEEYDDEDDDEDDDEEYDDEEYDDEDDEDDDEDDEEYDDEEYDDDEEYEEYEEYTEEELEELEDDELIEVAEDYEVDPVYIGKGKRKKLSRKRTIAAIMEVIEEDDEDEED